MALTWGFFSAAESCQRLVCQLFSDLVVALPWNKNWFASCRLVGWWITSCRCFPCSQILDNHQLVPWCNLCAKAIRSNFGSNIQIPIATSVILSSCAYHISYNGRRERRSHWSCCITYYVTIGVENTCIAKETTRHDGRGWQEIRARCSREYH